MEAEPGVSPTVYNLKTHLIPFTDGIIFAVPSDELKRIPYPHNTRVRLVPHTDIHMLRPSNWFAMGCGSMAPGGNFTVNSDQRGFHRIHLTMSEELFTVMVADMFMLNSSGHGFRLLLMSET